MTLAEVLITLGIIGVVCAITIPSLMQNIQDKQFKEAAKEAFSKASWAVQQMKIDEGGSLNYYYSTNNKFKPVFIKYFKIAKDCGIVTDNNLCVPSATSSTIYHSLTNQQTSTTLMDNGQFITLDGMFWGIENNSNYLIITVDVNGYTNGPNIFGRDTYMFQILNDILIPMGAIGTAYSSTTLCTRSPNTGQGWGCMLNVMQGLNY